MSDPVRIEVVLDEAAVDAIADAVADRVLERLDTREPPFLTVAEAADLAGVSTATVRRWIRSGRLTRHGGSPRRPLVERQALVDLLRGADTMGTETSGAAPRERPTP